MRAIVRLKQGASYRYKGYTFTSEPQDVTDPEDISYLLTAGVLQVDVVEGKPPPPAEPEDEGLPDDLPEDGSDDEVPGIPKKGKPGPKPKGK